MNYLKQNIHKKKQTKQQKTWNHLTGFYMYKINAIILYCTQVLEHRQFHAFGNMFEFSLSMALNIE